MQRGHRTWRVLNLAQEIDEDDASLFRRAARRAGLEPRIVVASRVARRAVDARRRKGLLRFACHVDLVVPAGARSRGLDKARKSGQVREAPPAIRLEPPEPRGPLAGGRVVVVGSGPAGVFAALPLALGGCEVTVLERGPRLEERHKRLVPFHRGGPLDPDGNLLYGEGGAGTYSDGKLYTRVDDPLEAAILDELVAAGAPEAIRFDARAHIGTDRLHWVLPALRRRLEAAGARFVWDTRFEGLVRDPRDPERVRAVRTSAGELPCDALFLALGHSARDTWEALLAEGVVFEPKPFQFGVRIEHPQELVTAGRYGTGPAAAQLGPASYNLVSRGSDQAPAAHSFCMCPGGKIVASISEAGALCTNGMSNSTHSSPWANAALVTTVPPTAYAAYGEGPLAGVAFQRHFERLFFEAGGEDYTAPAQRADDFLAGRASVGELRTSYTFGARPGRLDELLPPPIVAALGQALERWDRSVPGFAGDAGLLVGVEARSSGPVRMVRDRDSRRAAGFSNLFPIGEGAGHAGGIMSAAIDGAAAALAAMSSEASSTIRTPPLDSR